MKRSVAIVGPTPMFLRWAIEHPCPLREIYPDRLPETTFRQLRGLREISLAVQQKRIHCGYCLHSNALTDDADSLTGFSIDEVAEIFGGTRFVEDHCRACRANIGTENPSPLWCGCYGGVSSDLRIDFQSLVRGEHRQHDANETVSQSFDDTIHATNTRWDLPNLINRVVGENGLRSDLESNFPSSRSAWFALWQAESFDEGKLKILELILGLVLELLYKDLENDLEKEAETHGNTSSRIDSIKLTDLDRFRLAINRVRNSKERLAVELVPAGFSDGRTWQVDAHCKNCRRHWADRRTQCLECGERGQYQNQVKLKVLGLRPYVRLADVIGRSEAEKLIESYRGSIRQ